MAMTQSDLETILPLSTNMREYLATKYVISQVSGRHSSGPMDGMREMVSSMRQMVKDNKAEKKGGKKQNPFDSEEDEERPQFRVADLLWTYGLSGVPHSHMPPTTLVEKVASKAQSQVKAVRQFMAPGEVPDYVPQWLKDVPKDLQNCLTHAHGVAAWIGKREGDDVG